MIRLRTILFAAIIALCLSQPSRAGDATATAAITTKGDIYLGQRIILAVELRVPGIFDGAPIFQLPPASGLLLAPPTGSPVLSAETKEDVSYTIQRHEVSIFARRAGRIEIPPITIRLAYKKNPLDKNSVSESVTTPAVTIETKLPPGAEKLGSILSARNLKAEQSWSPDPATSHPKAGDAFTRTIHFSAPDIPAMAFPPFQPKKIDGIALYSKPPEVLDHSNRGELQGERRDTIVYVFQREGTFTIPAARLTWWDLNEKKLQTINFSAVIFNVAPNPAHAAQDAQIAKSAASHISLRTLARIAGILIVIALMLWISIRIHLWPALFRAAAHTIAKFRPVHLQPLNPTAAHNGVTDLKASS